MARQNLTDAAAALHDFAMKVFADAKKFGTEKQVIADFPLEPPQRRLVSCLPRVPAMLKKKLVETEADFTIAETARMLMALSDAFPIAEKLAESLQRVIAPTIPAAAGRRQGAKVVTGDVYQLKITLLRSKPPIWRRIQVKDCTLDRLHGQIQTAMGWTNSHLHHFKLGDQLFGDPELIAENFKDYEYRDSTATRLSDVIPLNAERLSFVYEYDFGDSWEHEVLVERALPADPSTEYPICTDGRRACPPEDVGGVPGYLDFLEAIRDEANERHEEMVGWFGGSFDPEEFDPAATTKVMRKR